MVLNMDKITPATYNLRVITVELVDKFISQNLFSTQKDALLFVCFKAQIKGVSTGFDDVFTMIDIKTSFNKIYQQYRDFRKVYNEENKRTLSDIL